MTEDLDLEGDCCEEELSDVQKEFYASSLQEYQTALAEAHILDQDNVIVPSLNNVRVVPEKISVEMAKRLSTTQGQAVVASPHPAQTSSLSEAPFTVLRDLQSATLPEHSISNFTSLNPEELETFFLSNKKFDPMVTSKLREHYIDGEVFLCLTAEDVLAMGFKIGHKIKIMNMVETMKKLLLSAQTIPVVQPIQSTSSEAASPDLLLAVSPVADDIDTEDLDLSRNCRSPLQDLSSTFNATESSATPDGSAIIKELEMHGDGRTILHDYNLRTTKILKPSERQTIVKIAVDKLIRENGMYPLAHHKEALANDIIAAFPCLRSDRDGCSPCAAFYNPRGKGYIDSRLQTIRTHLPEAEKKRRSQSRLHKKKNIKPRRYLFDTDSLLGQEIQDEQDILERISWLRTCGSNTADERMDIREYTNSTYQYRRQLIRSGTLADFQSIHAMWPRFTDFEDGELILDELHRRFSKIARMDAFFLQYRQKLLKLAEFYNIVVEKSKDENLMALLACVNVYPPNQDIQRTRSQPLSEQLIVFNSVNLAMERFVSQYANSLMKPFLVNIGTIDEPGPYFLILDSNIFVPVGHSISRSFEILFGSYHLYNFKYPDCLEFWFHMMEDVAFHILSDPPSTFLSFTSQLDSMAPRFS